MSNSDNHIPILTDIIDPENMVATAAPIATTISKPVASTLPVLPAVPVATAMPVAKPAYTEDDWAQLEHTLRENVLKQVLSRVDFVLEHRVRDSLADVLQTAVEKLADEIRGGLHKTLEEVINRAVSQEITKTRSQK